MPKPGASTGPRSALSPPVAGEPEPRVVGRPVWFPPRARRRAPVHHHVGAIALGRPAPRPRERAGAGTPTARSSRPPNWRTSMAQEHPEEPRRAGELRRPGRRCSSPAWWSAGAGSPRRSGAGCPRRPPCPTRPVTVVKSVVVRGHAASGSPRSRCLTPVQLVDKSPPATADRACTPSASAGRGRRPGRRAGDRPPRDLHHHGRQSRDQRGARQLAAVSRWSQHLLQVVVVDVEHDLRPLAVGFGLVRARCRTRWSRSSRPNPPSAHGSGTLPSDSPSPASSSGSSCRTCRPVPPGEVQPARQRLDEDTCSCARPGPRS